MKTYFADDVALLSSTHDHLQEDINRLNNFTKKTGLNTSTTKAQVMLINARSDEPIILNGSPLKDVEESIYLGSLLSKGNAAAKDIKARLGKAHSAFARLQSI